MIEQIQSKRFLLNRMIGFVLAVSFLIKQNPIWTEVDVSAGSTRRLDFNREVQKNNMQKPIFELTYSWSWDTIKDFRALRI